MLQNDHYMRAVTEWLQLTSLLFLLWTWFNSSLWVSWSIGLKTSICWWRLSTGKWLSWDFWTGTMTLLRFMRKGDEQIHHCRSQQNLLNVFAVSGFNFFGLSSFFGKPFIASGQLLTRENWVFDSFSLLFFVCMHVLLIFPWPLLLYFYINHPPVLLGSVPVSYPKSLFFFSPQSPMKPAQQNYNSYFPV